MASWPMSRCRSVALCVPTPKGARRNPNYEVTPEQIKRAAAKLKMETAADTAAILAGVERRRRAVEPARVLGGGRYAV